MRSHRTAAIVAGCLAWTAIATSFAPVATASSTLGTPSGVHVTAVSASSFTVSLNPAAYAEHYRLFASTTRSSVYVVNIDLGHAKASVLASSPTVSLSMLSYTTAPYYFRVETLQGTSRRWSDIYSVGLKPAMPTSVRVTSPTTGTYLTWSSGAATGYQIAQGTNYTQTLSRHIYTIRGLNHSFSPYYLSKGTTYYFRVRALNSSTGSSWSPRITVAPATRQQDVRLMTYNVLQTSADGSLESGTTIAPWSQRKVGAVKLITSANPDVIAVQEASDWTAAVKGPRQIDSLTAALGSSYALARTETPPSEPGYFRTGNYIVYNAAKYRTAGIGGHWSLPDSRFAPYQILQNRTIGAKVLIVNAHLTVGAGATNDSRRQAETKALISLASAYAAAAHVPVVYAGDFNSDVNANHAFDGPGLAMAAVKAADALDSAQVRSDSQYNSANRYLRTPPAFGQSIDHIYAPLGVGIRSWGLLLTLSSGNFVGTIPSDHNPLVSDLVIPF